MPSHQLKATGAIWDDVVLRRVFTVDVDKLQAAMRVPSTAGEQRASADQHHDRRDPPVPTDFSIEIDLMAITEG